MICWALKKDVTIEDVPEVIAPWGYAFVARTLCGGSKIVYSIPEGDDDRMAVINSSEDAGEVCPVCALRYLEEKA